MISANEQVSELTERGWTRIEGAIDPAAVTKYLETIRGLYDQPDNAPPGRIPFLNQGHRMVYNVQRKDFDILGVFLSHPAIRANLVALLNDQWYRSIPSGSPNYILRSLIGRSGGPEAMPLHIDSFIPASSKFAWSLQAALVLEEQTLKNGCTVAVPGSHLFDRYADQESLSRAEPILSKPGDIVMWDSRLWHGAMPNTTSGTRWSIVGTFTRWWVKQNYDITRTLPQAFYERLSNEEKVIVGYCSIPPRDESERIDIKGGYEDLLPRVEDYG